MLVPQVPPPLALSPPPPSPPALAKAITIEEPGSRLGIRTSDAADSGPKDKRIVFALLLFATIGVFTLAVKGAFAPRSRRGCISIRKSGRRGAGSGGGGSVRFEGEPGGTPLRSSPPPRGSPCMSTPGGSEDDMMMEDESTTAPSLPSASAQGGEPSYTNTEPSVSSASACAALGPDEDEDEELSEEVGVVSSSDTPTPTIDRRWPQGGAAIAEGAGLRLPPAGADTALREWAAANESSEPSSSNDADLATDADYVHRHRGGATPTRPNGPRGPSPDTSWAPRLAQELDAAAAPAAPPRVTQDLEPESAHTSFARTSTSTATYL